MLEVAILRVLFLQAINRRTPCSPWIPVSPKLSGRPSKATYHHGPPTTTHWAATGCPSRTGTASTPSWPGSPAGCSWDLAARLCRANQTTLRGRRTEWLAAGVFDKLVEEAIDGYDRIIAPGPVRGRRRRPACTKPRVVVKGPAPTPRTEPRSGGSGRSRLTCSPIPIGWVIDAGNRGDSILLEPTLQAVADRGLLLDIETLHLDRGYDSALTTQRCQALGLTDIVCAKKKRKGEAKIKKPLTLGLRWPVEPVNSWFSNFGQLRRNTDRFSRQPLGQVALAVALILTVKLVKWARRWTD